MKRYAILLSVILALSGLAAAQTGSQNVDTVIMVSSANYPDAMISAAPANKLGIPVLLTEKDQLPESTSNALDTLEPSEVIMIGGPSVISNEVQEEVESRVNTTTRLWGTTQIGTSVEVSSYFWSEGSDEAAIVQYPLGSETGYGLLAAVKEEVQDEDEPILVSKPGTLSAKILSEVERLGATEVEVYSTNAVNVTEDLGDIGVEDVEVEEAEIERLEDRVRNRTFEAERNHSTLVIVAAANFGDAISVPTSPNAASFIVSSEERIGEAVELVRDTDAETIKVTGQPDLANTIADRIENETDRTVDLVSGQDASEIAAQFTTDNRAEWRRIQQKRMPRWVEEARDAPGIRNAANKTLEQATAKIDSNSSEEAQELLVDAQDAYQDGDYFEARKLATRALSEANVEEFQGLDREEVRERVREDREDFREAAEELRELGQEQAQEFTEAETMEERLEIIRKYREEQRETIEDLRKEARDRQRDRMDDQAEVGSSEVRIQVEGTRVEGRIEYTGPTGGYTITESVDRGDGSVNFVFELSSPEGPATQVVTDYDARERVNVEEGNYTVSVELQVDGETVNQLSRDVIVPGFQEFESEIETEEDDSREQEETNETDQETEPENETEETEIELESTDDSFYRRGNQVSSITVPEGPVEIEFHANERNTYAGGVEYHSSPEVFEVAGPIAPGEDISVEFDAEEDFIIESYWPQDDVYKTEVAVNVE